MDYDCVAYESLLDTVEPASHIWIVYNPDLHPLIALKVTFMLMILLTDRFVHKDPLSKIQYRNGGMGINGNPVEQLCCSNRVSGRWFTIYLSRVP